MSALRLLTKLISCWFVVQSVGASTLLADFEFQSSRISSKPFEGIELPAGVEWFGDTESVDHPLNRRTQPSHGMIFWDVGPTTVRKRESAFPQIERLDFEQIVDSSNRAQFTSHSTGDHADAQFNRQLSNSRQYFERYDDYYFHESSNEKLSQPSIIRFTAEAPYYARIVNEEDDWLTEARSYATQDSAIADDSVTASGSVWAEVQRRTEGIDLSTSNSAGEAQSALTTKYVLTEPMDFILATTLAGRGEVEVMASLRDLSAKEDIFTAAYGAGQSSRWDLCGTLLPGEYEVAVLTKTTASHRDAEFSVGGQGQFDFYFRAFTPDIVGGAMGEPVPTSGQSTTWLVPEPSTATLAFILAAAISLRRRGRNFDRHR